MLSFHESPLDDLAGLELGINRIDHSRLNSVESSEDKSNCFKLLSAVVRFLYFRLIIFGYHMNLAIYLLSDCCIIVAFETP